MTKKIELLLPAGNLEKLKFAIAYGADAVYMGSADFSLRSNTGDDFSRIEGLEKGINYAKEHGVNVYLTTNIFARNEDLDNLEIYLNDIKHLNFDAIIISDPGVLGIVKDILPNKKIHLSTQANTTNWRSVKFWQTMGISRVILARELSLAEIKTIHEKCPDVELEAFVHGSMCMAYSGRCTMSNYMTDRDSNHGECSQSCRWSWDLVEEKRPGEVYHVEEDQHGTYLFNSKDLCMIEHLQELAEAGVFSFKVEGRAKSIYYLSLVGKTYRDAIDTYFNKGGSYKQEWMDEINTTSNRGFTVGFAYGKYDTDMQNYDFNTPTRAAEFVAVAQEYLGDKKMIQLLAKNRINKEDELELVTPSEVFPISLDIAYNQKGEEVPYVNTNTVFMVPFDREVPAFSIIRKRVKPEIQLPVIQNQV